MNLSLPVHRLSIQIAIEGQEGQFSTNARPTPAFHTSASSPSYQSTQPSQSELGTRSGTFNCPLQRTANNLLSAQRRFRADVFYDSAASDLPVVHASHCKGKGEVRAKRPKTRSTDQSSCSMLMLSTFPSALFPFPPSPSPDLPSSYHDLRRSHFFTR
jgi:hypothetical protein